MGNPLIEKDIKLCRLEWGGAFVFYDLHLDSRSDVVRCFARFDSRLAQTPFLLGDQPVYADFLLWGILGNYTWNGWNEIPGAMTALRGWRERLGAFSFGSG